ncbi:MAG: crossover junction endodeoxyribonuclease RuvC [Firmicutes bacterium]|nr:crossover junction endodeoxyribonuclease RuvC [Bacillota bacterium]
MKILGLDPGNAITGYGLITAEKGDYVMEEYGALRTPAGMPQEKRLLMLYDKLCELLERIEPDQVAVEELFFNRNTTTAVPVGQARGVLLLACAQRGLPVAEYTPLQVKQALTGYGRAEKTQIQYMVARLLHLDAPPKNDDAADALAIAITHANYYRGLKLRGEAKK